MALRQFIVHGICLIPHGPDTDKPFAHAWVEDDDENRVYQSGILNGEKVWYSVDRDEWKKLIRVQAFTRYTFEEAIQWNWRSNHYGPWVPEYVELCRDVQRGNGG